MKEQKEKSPVLVISTIIFLALFIILPPLFRTLFPKDTSSNEGTTKVFSLLTCTKTSVDGYTITSKVKYTDDNPDRNTIIYTKIPQSEQQETLPTTTTRTATEEITFFKAITDIQVIEGENNMTIIIKEDNINNNSNNIELANYLLPQKKQQEYYEEQEYTCSITKF